jgi:hypothetical protein
VVKALRLSLPNPRISSRVKLRICSEEILKRSQRRTAMSAKRSATYRQNGVLMAAEERVSSQQLANGLGWFSIGLGLAEGCHPKFCGRPHRRKPDSKTKKIPRIYGARELATGVGILSQIQPVRLALGTRCRRPSRLIVAV